MKVIIFVQGAVRMYVKPKPSCYEKKQQVIRQNQTLLERNFNDEKDAFQDILDNNTPKCDERKMHQKTPNGKREKNINDSKNKL